MDPADRPVIVAGLPDPQGPVRDLEGRDDRLPLLRRRGEIVGEEQRARLRNGLGPNPAKRAGRNEEERNGDEKGLHFRIRIGADNDPTPASRPSRSRRGKRND